MLLQWFTVEIFKIDCLVKMLVQKKCVRGDWLKTLPYREKDYINHKESRSSMLIEASLK